MSRNGEAGLPPASSTSAARAPWPVLPLGLLVTALAVALLAGEGSIGPWLAVPALVLLAILALMCGAMWARQRHLARLHEARQQHQLLGQLVDLWQWQTDAEHRLVRLQPPQRAPASAWVEGAYSGECLWQRFDDPDHSLAPRMQAHVPLPEMRVSSGSGAAQRRWRLRGLPRFDENGRFAGYLGVCEPTEQLDGQAAAQSVVDRLLVQGPGALCVLGPGADGQGPALLQANPAACALLGLTEPPDGRQAWSQVAGALPEGLRQRVGTLEPGQRTEHEGYSAWTAALDGPASRRLLALGTPAAGDDAAARALAAEHASFSYTISHDLRAPIRVVEGFARILKEDYGRALDRIGNDHVDRVLGAAARMNHMIDALLSLSRLSTQPLARQAVNLSQMAGWIVDDLRRGTPERQVSVHIAPDLQALGDPTLLRMVLENLLGNAWKYSGKVAQPQVVFETVHPEPGQWPQASGRQVFCVRDNGAGFDMRFADRLFGVFQRLHGSSDFPGTGIGLASVQRIVRRHGGEVWAESEVGHGARFYFTLSGR